MNSEIACLEQQALLMDKSKRLSKIFSREAAKKANLPDGRQETQRFENYFLVFASLSEVEACVKLFILSASCFL